MDFNFRHPQTGDTKTISLSEAQIQKMLTSELFDLLFESACNCQPIGETNVVECNCSEYFEQFELMEREVPNFKLRGGMTAEQEKSDERTSNE